MPKVHVKDNESIERALSRFKRDIDNHGLLKELRAREAYEKPTTERKRKKAAAITRFKREQLKHTLPAKLF